LNVDTNTSYGGDFFQFLEIFPMWENYVPSASSPEDSEMRAGSLGLVALPALTQGCVQ